MTEKVNENLKKKNDWARYAKIGLTAFLTVAACILFFFAIYRYDEIAKEWSKLMKAAEPIFFGLILAYLLMPVRNFIEPRVYKFLEGKMKKKERGGDSGGYFVSGSRCVAALVSGEQARSSLAAGQRTLSHLVVGDHASADPGGGGEGILQPFSGRAAYD